MVLCRGEACVLLAQRNADTRTQNAAWSAATVADLFYDHSDAESGAAPNPSVRTIDVELRAPQHHPHKSMLRLEAPAGCSDGEGRVQSRPQPSPFGVHRVQLSTAAKRRPECEAPRPVPALKGSRPANTRDRDRSRFRCLRGPNNAWESSRVDRD